MTEELVGTLVFVAYWLTVAAFGITAYFRERR